jgi:tetratricopeptide (TPR) repeat protein
LGYAGENAQAESLAQELARDFPKDTVLQFSILPTLRAKLALNRGKSAEAIESLRSPLPYERREWSLYPAYVRGEAYLAARRGPEAAVEFQKILDYHGLVLNDIIGALAHLEIARAYAVGGDGAKAKAAYQGCLALWKDADPRHPHPEASQSRVRKAKVKLKRAVAVNLYAGPRSSGELFNAIPHRHTNREPFDAKREVPAEFVHSVASLVRRDEEDVRIFRFTP